MNAKTLLTVGLGLIIAGQASAQYQFQQKISGLVGNSAPALHDSCKSILDNGESTGSGVYTIAPSPGTSLPVYCDMTSSGGGWTMVVAQFETNPVKDWNEGIQPDYDPTLVPGISFALSSEQIPPHSQTSFGKDHFAVFVDYINKQYQTGNIAKTAIQGQKTGKTYHLHRNDGHYYVYHNPDGSVTTARADWMNSLTLDEVGVVGYDWSFSPMVSAYPSYWMGYAMAGTRLTDSNETFAWTVWVR